MKITVLGGGRMGGAIAVAAAKAGCALCVSHASRMLRDELRAIGAEVVYTDDNRRAAHGADIIIVAVKPWFVEPVLGEIKDDMDPGAQMVVSVAAGVSFRAMEQYLGVGERPLPAMFRVVPNTAAALAGSVTFIASQGAVREQRRAISELFRKMGVVYEIEESRIASYTALSSCGIAFAFKYIDASAAGGEQTGIERGEALEIVIETIKGAIALLEANGTQPQQEIDKVATPGGITIKGLQAMEENGFTDAVVAGLKAAGQV